MVMLVVPQDMTPIGYPLEDLPIFLACLVAG
jgi:hypothetical protein